MKPKSYVDGVLIEWGDRWNWTPKAGKPQKPKKTSTGLFRPKQSATTPVNTVQATRRVLAALAKNTPQAVVKISGGGKGMKFIKNHLSYISRNGEVDLEDQDGEIYQGKEGLKEINGLWKNGFSPIPEESDKREAIQIVLSMPAGTDRLGVHRAARDFAKKTFGENHHYVFANHDDRPQPHVHLAVKVRGLDGTRLNPRKADLQQWRNEFVEALRAHGIEAVSTRRKTHLQQKRGDKQAVYHLKKRGDTLKKKTGTRPEIKAKAVQNRVKALRDYQIVTSTLAQSDAEDRKLALDLLSRLAEINKVNLVQDRKGKDIKKDEGRK